MRKIFWIRYLSIFLAFAPLVPQIVVAQSQSGYDQYMQLGYTATAKRLYHKALSYFQQAQQVRPGDKYADKAVTNIQHLLQRIAFIPDFGIPRRRVAAASRTSTLHHHIHHDPRRFSAAVRSPAPLVPQIVVAQSQSGYDQYMQLGYAATAKRLYHKALSYFQQAQQVRPGDKYADKAVTNIQHLLQRNRRNFTFIPPGVGTPGRRTSAASRSGSCIKGAQTPIAIVPEVDPQQTTTAHPTFFIYVPENSAQALEFKLSLHDDDSGQSLYTTTLKPNTTAGIVSITLPSGSDVPSLEVGKEYDWNFSVVCDPESRDKDVAVGGSVERIQPDPNLVTQLATLPPTERADLYAASGIWIDSLDTLADLRRSQPNNSDLKTDWEELLESVGLEEKIATSPLL